MSKKGSSDYEKRITRMLAIIRLVQSQRGLGPKDLASHFGVTERTVYRDLDHLKMCGIPIGHEPERGYVIPRHFHMAPIQLTLEEALAIAALADHLGADGQIPFLEAAAEAGCKVLAQLPAPLRETFDMVRPAVSVKLHGTGAGEGVEDVRNRIIDAILARTSLVCTYEPVRTSQPGSRDDAFDFEPYALFFHSRDWYVVGRRGDRGADGALRTLKLRRFSGVRATTRPYEIPGDFSLEAYLGQAWRMIRGEPRVRVRVRFDPEFAETVADTRWHATQEEENQPDGSVVLAFEVDGLDEIVWWILGYGPHCEVLEPAALRDRVRELAAATASRYA